MLERAVVKEVERKTDSSGFLGRGQRGRSCRIIQESLEEVWRNRTAMALSLRSWSVVPHFGAYHVDMGMICTSDAAYRTLTGRKACLSQAA